MKKIHTEFLKKTAAALCTASLLLAAGPGTMFCTAYAEEVSVYDVIPESVTISYGCALGDIGLPDSELGSLVWASPDYVPTGSEETCRAFLYPEDGVDLTGEEDWDEDEGAVVVYITVFVSGAEEENQEEDYQEEEYAEAEAAEENTDAEAAEAGTETEAAEEDTDAEAAKEDTDAEAAEENSEAEAAEEENTDAESSDTEELPDKAEAAAVEEASAEDPSSEADPSAAEASAEEEPSSAEEPVEEDPSLLKTADPAAEEGQIKAAEETGSAFGIAGSDTVVGGEIAQGNYNTTPAPGGNGAAVQETTGGQGQTEPVTGPVSAGASSQQNNTVQSSTNNTQSAQVSAQNNAAVRTGDDTNITPMVILIAAAAVVIIAAIIALLMKRRK